MIITKQEHKKNIKKGSLNFKKSKKKQLDKKKIKNLIKQEEHVVDTKVKLEQDAKMQDASNDLLSFKIKSKKDMKMKNVTEDSLAIENSNQKKKSKDIKKEFKTDILTVKSEQNSNINNDKTDNFPMNEKNEENNSFKKLNKKNKIKDPKVKLEQDLNESNEANNDLLKNKISKENRSNKKNKGKKQKDKVSLESDVITGNMSDNNPKNNNIKNELEESKEEISNGKKSRKRKSQLSNENKIAKNNDELKERNEETNESNIKKRKKNKNKKKLSKDLLNKSEDKTQSEVENNEVNNDKSSEENLNDEKDSKFDSEEKDLLKNERSIFVGNIPKDTEKKEIKKYFREFGIIETVRIRSVVPEDLKLSKKVAAIKKQIHPKVNSVNAYVVYKEEKSANDALVANGKEFNGNVLRVDTAVKKNDHDQKKAVFLGNLPIAIQDNEILKHFSSCGAINSVNVIRDKRTGVGKGFGYINFENKDSIPLALELNESLILNRPVRVKICAYNENKKKAKITSRSKNYSAKILNKKKSRKGKNLKRLKKKAKKIGKPSLKP